MLTLRGMSSTVFTVRLDTECCKVMFAAKGHNCLPMVQGRLPAEQRRVAGPRPGGRFAAAGRRRSTPLGGG